MASSIIFLYFTYMHTLTLQILAYIHVFQTTHLLLDNLSESSPLKKTDPHFNNYSLPVDPHLRVGSYELDFVFGEFVIMHRKKQVLYNYFIFLILLNLVSFGFFLFLLMIYLGLSVTQTTLSVS